MTIADTLREATPMTLRSKILLAIGVFIAPFVFYGWLALVARFMNWLSS